MFMRYFGGGIGHTAVQTQLENEDDMMDVDERGDHMADTDQASSAKDDLPELGDACLLEELHQMAHMMVEGQWDGDRDEIEEPMDIVDDGDDEGMRGADDNLPMGDSDAEDFDFGPEDGEDERYFDTGFGSL